MQFTDIGPTLNNGIISLLEEGFLIVALIGIFLYIMARKSRSFRAIDVSSMKINPTRISLVLLLIAILCPAYLTIFSQGVTYPSIGLFSMSWQIGSFNPISIQFGPYFLLMSLLLMFMRIVFVYYIFKYYYGETTQTRVIIAGLIGELQPLLIGMATLPFVLATPGLGMAFPVPLPVLLFTGLLAMNILPVPPIQGDWKELEEQEDWWEKES
jgi:hypothetical protein